MKYLTVLSAICLGVLGCGTPSSSTSTASGGGEGAGSPSEIVCPAGHEVMVVPAVSETDGCVVTNEQLDFSVCVGPLNTLFVPTCHERIADGARFWFALPLFEVALPEGFKDCGGYPPRSCEFEECEESFGFFEEEPLSICSAEETTKIFDCGGAMSVWDEGCCFRRACHETPCEPGFTCRSVPRRSMWASPLNNGQETLDCAEYVDLEPYIEVEVCFPE